MRIGGKIAGLGSRFGGGGIGRLEEAVRRRLLELARERPRAGATGEMSDGTGARRLSLAERLRVIEEAER